MIRKYLISGLITAAFSLSSCAQQTDQSAGGTASNAEGPAGRAGVPAVDWAQPLSSGITLKDMVDANSLVPFDVADPGLASPILVQADDPKNVEDPASRLVAFVYDLPDIGMVNIEEQLAIPGVAKNLAERAQDYASSPDPAGTSPSFEMVPLGDGEALLVSGSSAAVIWVQGRILVQVLGEAVTPDQARKLASTVYTSIEEQQQKP